VKSTAQKTGEKDLMLVPWRRDGVHLRGHGAEPAGGGISSIVRQPAAPEWRAFGSVDIEPKRQDPARPRRGYSPRCPASPACSSPWSASRQWWLRARTRGCSARAIRALRPGVFAVAVLVLIAARSEVAASGRGSAHQGLLTVQRAIRIVDDASIEHVEHRSARAATDASWVTSTTVRPLVLRRSLIRSSTRAPASESRLPVARPPGGSEGCWRAPAPRRPAGAPSGQLRRALVRLVAHAHQSEQRLGSHLPVRPEPVTPNIATWTFSLAVSVGNRL